MKSALISALSLVALCASPALAGTINFSGSDTVVGHSQTYSSGPLSVTAYAFNSDGTWRWLYGKNDGPTEAGVGIFWNTDNEIDNESFVQLNVSSITSPFTLSIGSTQDDEGFSVYGSNTLGSLGALLSDYHIPTADPFTTGTINTAYKYVSVIADGNQGKSADCAGNVLLDSLTTTSAVTPEPSSIVLLLTGIAGAAGAARRRLSL